MICIDINLRLFFDDITVDTKNCDRAGVENAVKELFDDVFIDEKEYVRTEAKIQDIKEVA